MILGNITSIKVGSTSQSKVFIGTTQVWPLTPSISVDTAALIIASASTTDTIGVTASTTAWTVISSQSWLTVEKVNDGMARFTASTNTTTYVRNAYIYFMIDGVTYATTQITQAEAMAETITINPVSLTNLASAGTSANISVTATSNSWTATTSEYWISLSKTNNSQLQVTVAPNTNDITGRTGYVYFSIGGNILATATVTQAAAAKRLVLSPNTLTGQTESAATGTVLVSTNLPSWGVWITYKDPNTNWISASKVNSTSFTWSITENTSGALRQAVLTASGDGISQTIQLTQTAGYIWNISSSANTVSSGAGAIQVVINSSYQGVALGITTTINANTIGATMTLVSSGSAGYYVYNITYPARTETTDGIFAVLFRQAETQQVLTYVLTQNGAPTTLSISPTAMTEISSAGSVQYFTVTTNASSWSATKSGSWFTITQEGNRLKVSATTNQSTSERTGTVTFTAGDKSVTANLTQQAKYIEPSIDGFVTAATYPGGWLLGGYYTGSDAGPNPIWNIAVVNTGVFSENHTATISMTYTNMGGTQTTVTNQTYTISPSVITIPSTGAQCLGYPIIPAVRSLETYPPSVTRFEVS